MYLDAEICLSVPQCSSDPVLAVTFSHEDSSRIITSGKNSIVFWSLNGDSLKKRTGTFRNNPKPKYITTVAFTPEGQTVTGDSAGNIALWQKGIFLAHKGKVITYGR